MHFMYRKNFFGDIVAIYQGATKIAEYSYDAWGNCTIVSDYNGYGARNPFRYRGYYFDSDLGMYYLTTRYYDPKTGRFINADAIEYLKPDAINGLNLYTYCLNNPIMYVDPYGHDWKSFWEDVWNALVEIYMRALNVQMNNQIYQIEVTQTQVDMVQQGVEVCYDNYMFSQNLETQSSYGYPEKGFECLAIGVGTVFYNGLKPLEEILSPEQIEESAGGFVESAENSSVFLEKYNQVGGEHIFEAMWDEFYGR